MPIPCEITYGLERLAMYLQGVDNVFDVAWNKNIKYGEVHHQTEYEFSVFNFSEADIDFMETAFTHYFDECKKLVKKNLVFPAYDCVMKCSHYFNLLEARGAISVSERANYIMRVRDIAKSCALAYLKKRESMSFPLLDTKK